ncbi:MAG: hypothetical protein JWM53_6913 [bacterium]|nr:hypothetical protein [bacterium]
MRRLALFVALVAVIVAVGGCRNSFDPASSVDKLRLLAVKADPPEVAPGAATTLHAIWANPGGSAPAIRWDACLEAPPPATGRSVNPDCFGLDGGSPLEPLGQGETLATTMPMVTPAMLGLPDATNGFYVWLRVQLDADGNTLLGFYGLRVSLGALSPNPPNQNPALTGIFTVPSADAGVADQTALDEAAPPEVHANDKIDLRALLTPESSESYIVFDGDPRTTPPRTATETVGISWYTTAGTFDNDVTGVAKPDTTLTLDKHLPPSNTPIDLWAVARDERGGLDFKHAVLLFR